MKSYKVYFNSGANHGSFAVDDIAQTVDGDWTNSTDDFAIITIDDGNAEYLEEILSSDERVETYRTE